MGLSGKIKVTAFAKNPLLNDITTIDPTNGGANPNGDVLCYLNLSVNANSQGSDALTLNSSEDSLIPANENGLTAGTIYPNLDDFTYGTTNVTFGTTPPVGELSIQQNIPPTIPGATVTVAVNYTPVTPGGSGISSADAAILFDPNYLSLTSVTEGNLIPTDGTENWSITSAVRCLAFEHDQSRE